MEKERTKNKPEAASGLIILAIGNSPLCIIDDVDDDLTCIIEMFDERYALSRRTSRIAVKIVFFV